MFTRASCMQWLVRCAKFEKKIFKRNRTANMWKKLYLKNHQLTLNATLNGGQSFRWKKVMKNETEQWIGVFSNSVWILIENDDHLMYQVHFRDESAPLRKSDVEVEQMLMKYFRFDINIEEYFNKWSLIDENFKLKSNQTGIRMLSQEFVENLFSFICSSNNNIKRISNMVENLSRSYGEKICELDDYEYYSFPTIESLSGEDVEQQLRNQGFGYRANYISESAKKIHNYGANKWITELSEMDYISARNTLMTLKGVGKKVADCICLMSLNHLEAIPVDTHIFQVAKKYLPHLSSKKTVTDKSYNEISEFFRNLYGPLAGWAQTILFCSDLKNLNKSDVRKLQSN